MKAARRVTFVAVLSISVMVLSSLAPSPANAAWPADGVPVCVDPASQETPHVISDGAGGAFVAWEDGRDGLTTIYAQRLDGSGNPYWTTDGLAVTETEHYDLIEMFEDGAGGAILVLNRSGDIWAHRFDSDGTMLWGSLGVIVTSGLTAEEIAVAPDGLGGFVTAFRAGNDIYAQRVNSEGALSWDEVSGLGAVVGGDFHNPAIVSDGAGGVFVAFHASPYGHIFAQRVYPSGAVWQLGGIDLDPDVNRAFNPVIALDGYGGAVIAWEYDGMDTDIRAQRIDGGGNPYWVGGPFDTPIGEYICQAAGNQISLAILSDGEGGAYITWEDERGSYPSIYAQHFDGFGMLCWAAEGIQVGHDIRDQNDPVLFKSGGKFIAAWRDRRWDVGLAAQKFDASGMTLWPAGGVYVGRVAPNQEYDFSHDGAGGLFITTMDSQMPYGEGIFAQSICYDGTIPAPHPVISQVSDVPADQGGSVRLTVTASDYDDMAQAFFQVTRYDVWQRVDGALYPELEAGASLTDRTGEDLIVGSGEGRYMLTAPTGADPQGTWEFVGSFDAKQNDEYIFRASTLADSTSLGIPYNVYIVSAHTVDPSAWYVSAPDSGYSVDNLPPAVPSGIAGEQNYAPEGLALAWDPNTENDLSHYAIYRGTTATFIPYATTLVATSENESWFDDGWDWEQGYWYKIAAVDIHENVSDYALLGPSGVTGDDLPGVPEANYLAQNYPNPFNPSTTIAFGLSRASHVKLKIYDTSGRLVRVVLDEDRAPGHYEAHWNGLTSLGQRAASGVYFFRLTAESFIETRKMILLK